MASLILSKYLSYILEGIRNCRCRECSDLEKMTDSVFAKTKGGMGGWDRSKGNRK